MWFFFGFITFLSFSIYSFFKYRSSHWKGTHKLYKDKSFNITYIQGKNLLSKNVLFGIETFSSSKIDFSIKKENKLDKFFKKIGISVETQVSNEKFDDKLYIVSDNKFMCNFIKDNEEVQNVIYEIFRVCKKGEINLKGLHYQNNRLWIEMQNGEEAFRQRELLPLMKKIIFEIEKDIDNLKYRANDSFVKKAIVVLSVSSGLAITGLTSLFMPHLIYKTYSVIDSTSLYMFAFIIGSIIISFLVLFAFYMLGKSSRTHLVLIEILTIGYIGSVLTSYTLLSKYNHELDISEAKIINTVVANTSRTYRSKGRTAYYLHFKEIVPEEYITKIKVSSDMYNRYNNNSKVIIELKEGYFGYRWIKSIKKRNK